MEQLPFDSRFDEHRPRQVHGWPWMAWIVIILVSTIVIIGHHVPQPAQQPSPEGGFDVKLMTFQSQALVGMAEVLGGTQQHRNQIYRSNADALNAGSVAQRQRFIVLAAELAGPTEARARLDEFEDIILNAQMSAETALMTEQQEQVQEILRTLYTGEEDEWHDRIGALSPDDRNLLEQQLGWFGQLAMVPPESDGAARAVVVSRARTVAWVLFAVVSLGGLALLAGFVSLIMFSVLVINGSVRSGMGERVAHHGIYAETFAVWMVVFIVLQIAASAVSVVAPGSHMLAAFFAFFASLIALAWPMLRGVPWSSAKVDMGLTFGRKPLVEPIVGVFGYILGLPMLVIGIILTLVLITAYTVFTGGAGGPLAPQGGPAHPIVDQLAGAGVWPIVQIFLVAAVAAPVVEEIMFRGVLYRHLRSATSGEGVVLSVLISTVINTFLFAVIHPQGFLAVPALMSLAVAFTLVREWRGTIVPSIVIHAISNGLVMSLLVFIIGSATV